MPLPSGDVVVTLLSPDGKWRAVARKGRLLGGNPGRLSLFHDVTVQVYQRREEDLAVVTQVQLNAALPRMTDPVVYPYAHLLAELADRLTVDSDDVHIGEPLHAWLASGLRGLGADGDPERVALVHAWMLLRVAGLGPDVTATGGAMRFDLAGGRVASDGEGIALSDDAARELLVLIAGRAREGLAEPLAERALHWRLLARYVAWHVTELHTLNGRLGQGPTAVPPPATAEEAVP